jgi:NADH-quinone oxidoreductase subunit L
MNYFIYLFVLIPFLGYLVSLLLPKRSEKLISKNAKMTVALTFLVQLYFCVNWLVMRDATIQSTDLTIYQAGNYKFYLSLFFDRISATYALMGAMLTFLILFYSKYYLHREVGFKRFFNVILLFFTGYNLVVVSGNLETMFIGWEILGISSFLLIGFYRERYRPVKNSLKVFSIYRIGDVGVIIAMWLSHLLWHENVSFSSLRNAELVHEHLLQHSWIGIVISLALLLSATTKSAQFPFSYWLPRAMEGPTPSSAIFYGSLAVHIGAFLLMRTYNFWENQYVIRAIIIVIGLLTSFTCVFTARVQSSVKSQIAYSSLAQIGLIFVEIGFGLEIVALMHVIGNAFLRSYQLLVSPSMVSYKIREQQYVAPTERITKSKGGLAFFGQSIYLLSLKEWNMDFWVDRIIWNPFRKVGRLMNQLPIWFSYSGFVVLVCAVLFLKVTNEPLSATVENVITGVYLSIALLIAVQAFTGKRNFFYNWNLVFANHILTVCAVYIHHHNIDQHLVIYLSGVIVSFILGLYCLNKLKKESGITSMYGFKGRIHNNYFQGGLFLIACLGMAGFPVTPTFIGEDLFFTGLEANQWFLAVLMAFSFIINGLALIRMFARIYLGKQVDTGRLGSKRSA